MLRVYLVDNYLSHRYGQLDSSLRLKMLGMIEMIPRDTVLHPAFDPVSFRVPHPNDLTQVFVLQVMDQP
jgi:hypothetical protein